MNVPTYLIVSIAIYLVLLLVIGWVFGRKNQSASDFLVASHSLPTPVAILTLTATMFGGGMLVARTGWGYRRGTVFFIYALISFVNQALLALLIPKFRNFTNYTTVTEFLEDRYRSKLIRSVCAFMSMISLIVFTASQVNALVAILTAMGFENPKMIAFFCMVVIIALTVFGGMLAVSATDSFQMILIIVGVAILIIRVLAANGGYGNIVAQLHAQAAAIELPEHYTETFYKENVLFVFWMMVPGVLEALIGQEGYQRLFACKNLKEARKCSFIAGILMTLIASCPVIFGMVARLDFPELAANGTHNTALAMVIMKYLPGALSGILLCAILSAILSTGDSMLSSATSHFITDFWNVYIEKDADMNSKHMLRVSRAFTLVAGIIALLLSFCFTDILTPMITANTLYAAGAFCPIIMGVLWKKTNRYGCIAGMAAGMLMCVLGLYFGVAFGPVPGEMTSVIAGAVVTAVVSLATQKQDPPIVVE